MKLYLLLISSVLALSSTIFGQSVEIQSEILRTGNGTDAIFTANNTTQEKITILFDFRGSNLLGSNFNGGNVFRSNKNFPIITTLDPGRNYLAEIKGFSNTANYTFAEVSGCLNTTPREVTYLLPVAPGNSTTIDTLSSRKESILGDELPENGIVYRMSASPGDHIYASRRGTVIAAETAKEPGVDDKLSSPVPRTYVTIQHPDCTRGQYEFIDPESLLVAVGDEVKAGTPLGKVGADHAPTGGPDLRFYVYYPEISRSLMRQRQADRFAPIDYVSVQPDFFNIGQPEPGKTYTSKHPEEVIIQEMSRQQFKQYLKTRPERVIIVE